MNEDYGNEFTGVGGRDVGFRRDGKPKPNEPAVFGPSVREPQKTLEINRRDRRKEIVVPLEGRLRKDGSAWKLTVGKGLIVPRHNASGDTGAPITITDLPVEGSPMTVAKDDKCYVKLTIAVTGKVTAGVFEKAATWPTDTPPSLVGGSSAGAEGTRHIRILEIIEDPDTPVSGSPDALLLVDQLHTGHIDHFQPALSENTTASPGDSEARVLKQWNASAGRFDFRFLKAICGLKFTENTDHIELKPDGDSFRVRLWHTTISGSTDSYGYGEVIVDAGVSPAQEFWVLNGVWYITEPDNWGTCGGSSEPVYDVTWAIPTVGGPE